jgi:hypothetical protein
MVHLARREINITISGPKSDAKQRSDALYCRSECIQHYSVFVAAIRLKK